MQPGVYDSERVQSRLTQLLEKYYSGLWMSKLPGVYGEMFGEKLHPQGLIDLEKWPHVCMVSKQLLLVHVGTTTPPVRKVGVVKLCRLAHQAFGGEYYLTFKNRG